MPKKLQNTQSSMKALTLLSWDAMFAIGCAIIVYSFLLSGILQRVMLWDHHLFSCMKFCGSAHRTTYWFTAFWMELLNGRTHACRVVILVRGHCITAEGSLAAMEWSITFIQVMSSSRTFRIRLFCTWLFPFSAPLDFHSTTFQRQKFLFFLIHHIWKLELQVIQI